MSRQVASLSGQGLKDTPPQFVYAEKGKIGIEVKCDAQFIEALLTCQHALAAAEDTYVYTHRFYFMGAQDKEVIQLVFTHQ